MNYNGVLLLVVELKFTAAFKENKGFSRRRL
jgi:hypothetical protein